MRDVGYFWWMPQLRGFYLNAKWCAEYFDKFSSFSFVPEALSRHLQTWEGKKKQKFDFDICKKASNTRPLDLISALLFPWAIGCQRDLLFVIFIVLVIVFVIVFFIVIVIVAYMRMKPVESTGLGFFHLSKNSILDLKTSKDRKHFFQECSMSQCRSKSNCSILVPMRTTRSSWRQKYCCAMISNIIYIIFVILISNFTFSADGYYEVQLMTKAVLRFDGVVIWQPPATYKGTPAKWIHKVAKKSPLLENSSK